MTFQNSTNKDFRHQFLESSIYREGQKCSPDALKNELVLIENLVVNTFSKPQMCFVRDADSLRLALIFFTLIDYGHCPILLDAELNDYQLESMVKSSKFSLIDQIKVKSPSAKNQDPAYPDCYAALTSGTTATPKLCYLSIEGALKNAGFHAKSLGITDKHTVIQSLPINHSYGIVAYLWTKVVKGCGLDLNENFLGLKTLAQKKFEDGALHISPAQLQFMLKEPESNLSGIDIISVGGGLAESSEILRLKEKFNEAKTYITYGLTEAGPRVSTGEVAQEEPSGYIGQPFNGVGIAVLQEDGQIVPEGEGSLCVSSPSLKMNLAPDELTQYQGKSFLITRDLVSIMDGSIFFKSRDSDLIKVGGISVYPKDIENVIRKIENVKDCIVFPMEHRIYGSVPLLIIEGTGEIRDIQNFVKDKLSVYQRPRKVVFLKEFPRHSLNKIDRKRLKEMIG
jgi:acyl-CoA synthetase (AMP-forming)/AMP-acid ligase II